MLARLDPSERLMLFVVMLAVAGLTAAFLLTLGTLIYQAIT